jgi:poly(hydroxyalkanoate) granule-associated protein
MPKTTKAVKRVPMLRGAAEQIYLAGLGAFAIAEEGGSKVFETLVKRGKGLEKINKARLHKVLGQVGHQVEGVREGAEGAFGRLTAPIDAGMTTALHRLGVPTRKEIALLTRRVEELTRSVERKGARRPLPRRRARAAARKAIPVAAVAG